MTDILNLDVKDESLNNVISNNPYYIDIKGSVNICLIRCGQEIEKCNNINFSTMTNYGKILVLNPDPNSTSNSTCNIKLAFDTTNDNINNNGSANYKFEKAFFTVPSFHKLNGQIFDMETFLVFSCVQKNGNILYVCLCTLSNGINNVQSNDWKLLNYKLMNELFSKNNTVPEMYGTSEINGIPNPVDLGNFIPKEGFRNFYDYTHPSNTKVNFRIYQTPLSVSNDVITILKTKLTPGNIYTNLRSAISKTINPPEGLFFYFSEDLTDRYKSLDGNNQNNCNNINSISNPIIEEQELYENKETFEKLNIINKEITEEDIDIDDNDKKKEDFEAPIIENIGNRNKSTTYIIFIVSFILIINIINIFSINYFFPQNENIENEKLSKYLYEISTNINMTKVLCTKFKYYFIVLFQGLVTFIIIILLFSYIALKNDSTSIHNAIIGLLLIIFLIGIYSCYLYIRFMFYRLKAINDENFTQKENFFIYELSKKFKSISSFIPSLKYIITEDLSLFINKKQSGGGEIDPVPGIHNNNNNLLLKKLAEDKEKIDNIDDKYSFFNIKISNPFYSLLKLLDIDTVKNEFYKNKKLFLRLMIIIASVIFFYISGSALMLKFISITSKKSLRFLISIIIIIFTYLPIFIFMIIFLYISTDKENDLTKRRIGLISTLITFIFSLFICTIQKDTTNPIFWIVFIFIIFILIFIFYCFKSKKKVGGEEGGKGEEEGWNNYLSKIGSSGPSGTSTFTGTTGPDGTSETSTFTGTTGPDGTSETSTFTGTTGPDGTSGTSETSTFTGTTGPDGTSGTSETSTFTGTTGTTKSSGTSTLNKFTETNTIPNAPLTSNIGKEFNNSVSSTSYINKLDEDNDLKILYEELLKNYNENPKNKNQENKNIFTELNNTSQNEKTILLKNRIKELEKEVEEKSLNNKFSQEYVNIPNFNENEKTILLKNRIKELEKQIEEESLNDKFNREYVNIPNFNENEKTILLKNRIKELEKKVENISLESNKKNNIIKKILTQEQSYNKNEEILLLQNIIDDLTNKIEVNPSYKNKNIKIIELKEEINNLKDKLINIMSLLENPYISTNDKTEYNQKIQQNINFISNISNKKLEDKEELIYSKNIIAKLQEELNKLSNELLEKINFIEKIQINKNKEILLLQNIIDDLTNKIEVNSSYKNTKIIELKEEINNLKDKLIVVMTLLENPYIPTNDKKEYNQKIQQNINFISNISNKKLNDEEELIYTKNIISKLQEELNKLSNELLQKIHEKKRDDNLLEYRTIELQHQINDLRKESMDKNNKIKELTIEIEKSKNKNNEIIELKELIDELIINLSNKNIQIENLIEELKNCKKYIECLKDIFKDLNLKEITNYLDDLSNIIIKLIELDNTKQDLKKREDILSEIERIKITNSKENINKILQINLSKLNKKFDSHTLNILFDLLNKIRDNIVIISEKYKQKTK